MTFTITFAWWQVPLVVTCITMFWVFFWPANESGYCGDAVRPFRFMIALIIALAFWAVAGAIK